MKQTFKSNSAFQKYPLIKKMNLELNSYNKLPAEQPKKLNVSPKTLSTNVTFNKPEHPVTIINNSIKQKEPEVQVSNGGLKLPPKEPDQFSTSIDMTKDEWSLGELLDLNVDQIPFLIEKLIPLHTLNVLAGQSERGKSTMYTQLALAIIMGDEKFLGCKINATHKRVLVISTEDGPVALSFRANKQLASVSTAEIRDRLNFITNHENLEERIEKFLKTTKVDLIVLDAFADVFTGGDINAANSVRRYFNIYLKFIQLYGCSVLFVHHVSKGKQGNKSEKDQLLGSTGIEGKMRNVLMLSIVNEQHQLSIAKGNYVKREDRKEPIYLNFDSASLTFSVADGPAPPLEPEGQSSGNGAIKLKPGKQKDVELYNRAIQLHKEGKSQVDIAKELGKHKSTICNWIKEHRSSEPESQGERATE